jgi:hypothetical protein
MSEDELTRWRETIVKTPLAESGDVLTTSPPPPVPVIYTVILESPGGGVDTGLWIGRLIRAKKFTTRVEDNASCNSICAIIWLGGAQRIASAGSLIGFHAAFDTRNNQVSGSPNAIIGIYLRDMGLSDNAIRYLLEAGPDEIKYLSRETAKNLGIAYQGDLPTEGAIQLKLQRAGRLHVQPELLPPATVLPPAPTGRALASCSSQAVFKTLQSIGARNWILLYYSNAVELSSTPDMRFCRALTVSTAGKRWLNYTITWTNRDTGQFWVQVTGYSRALWP